MRNNRAWSIDRGGQGTRPIYRGGDAAGAVMAVADIVGVELL